MSNVIFFRMYNVINFYFIQSLNAKKVLFSNLTPTGWLIVLTYFINFNDSMCIFNIKVFIILLGCFHPSDVFQHKPFFRCMSRYVHLDIHISDVIRGKAVKHDIIHADLYVSNNSQWSPCNFCVFQDP